MSPFATNACGNLALLTGQHGQPASTAMASSICSFLLFGGSLSISKSLNFEGEEVARQLIACLSTELGISSDKLVASMRDRASVNTVAIRTLSIVFPQLIDIGCFSHTIDHVGNKMHTPILDEFIKLWINLFSKSPNQN